MNQAWDCPGYALIFSAYEGVLHYFRDHMYGFKGVLIQLLGGGIGGLMCWIPTYPVDVIKTYMQTHAK